MFIDSNIKKTDTMPSIEKVDVLWDCLVYGGLGSLAGVAALIRSEQPLTKRAFLSALINSAMFSIAIGYFIIWRYGEENYILAIVLSILSGLGGTALMDFFFGLVKLYFKKRIDDE